MNRIFQYLCVLLLASLPALAQVGPGPTPSPWVLNGAQIYYAQGCTTVSATKPGGCHGIGSFSSDTFWLNGTQLTLPITAANGGTGITSYAIGDLLYASASTTLSKLADVAAGSVLVSGGVTTAPAYSSAPTITGAVTAARFVPTGSTIATNGLYLTAANTPSISANSLLVGQYVSAASAVTALEFGAGSTGNASTIRAFGETNTPLALSSNGTGHVQLYGGNFGAVIADFIPVASASRYITFTNSNGSTPIISTSAGDIRFNRGLTTTAAFSANVTSSMGMDFSSGTGRIQSIGADASTAGGFSITGISSDGSITRSFLSGVAGGTLTVAAPTIFSNASQTTFSGAGVIVSGAGSAAAASMIMIDQASTTNTRLRVFGPTGAATYGSWTFGSNKSDGTTEVDWLTVDTSQNVATSRPWAFSGTTAFTSTATFSGTSGLLATKLVNAAEPSTISATAATGTINYDVCTQSILYYTTSAAANWTLNLRCSSGTSLNTAMATGDTVTVTFLVTQGASPFYNNALQVDGGSVTPKYQGGTAWSAGNASGIDAYTYAIVKTGSAAFTVLASQTQFK